MQTSSVPIGVSAFKKNAMHGLTLLVVASLATSCLMQPPAFALEASTLPTSTGTGEFSLEPDSSDHEKERKEIEALLHSIEEEWNSHNLDKVMSHYADDYVNNDGLDKKAVSALTQDFWRTYPDARSSSRTKEIRIDGNFATVESRDMAVGSTAKPMPGIGTGINGKGDLNSISEGQLYIKRYGGEWKIIGDRIDFEKVKVAFGLAKKLSASFSAPEQVKSGHTYSAKLEMDLPLGYTAVGSITSQPLEYPQPSPPDKWRPLDGPVLERIMPANTHNRNELLMATIGITNAQRTKLEGITFLTRRLNVVPTAMEEPGKDLASKPATKSDTEAHKVEAKASEKPSTPEEPATSKDSESMEKLIEKDVTEKGKDTEPAKDAPDSKDSKDTPDSKDSKDSKDSNESKD